jgi:hypothetical protein
MPRRRLLQRLTTYSRTGVGHARLRRSGRAYLEAASLPSQLIMTDREYGAHCLYTVAMSCDRSGCYVAAGQALSIVFAICH